MNAFRISSFFVCLFLAQTSVAATLTNLGQEFDAFLTAADGGDHAVVEAEWVKFEARHQALYDAAVYRKSDKGWETRQLAKRNAFFSEYRTLAPKMDLIFNDAANIVARQEAHFRTLFPDLPTDIPVVFLPSLGSFNGQVRSLQENAQPSLLIGVDFIAKRGDNLDVLFSHEFFHTYHERHLPEGSTGQTMATPLWKEGFATYVSGLFNPNSSDGELLMDNDLAKSCADSDAISKMAEEYLTVLKTDGSDTYNNWFLASGSAQPTRRGYCLGLQVLRKISAQTKISELVTWREDRFSQAIEEVLQSLVSASAPKLKQP